MTRCPSCGHEVPGGSKFCNECGARLAAPTAEDRAPRDYTPKHLADKILQSKSALEGERKQVTVLFADVKGSMELAEQLDPEEWHRILERFFEILTEGVHRFEGTVNQYTGDGIMALFGAPIAHEDHAQRACHAALWLREELRRYADALRVERGLSFSVRMGINSGEVVVGKIGDDLRMDYTAQGHTVGLAARMEQLAAADRAYLTGHTADLVGGYFELRDLGASQIKGLSEPLHLFELEDVGRLRTRLELSRARGFSRFVGRDEEVAVLEDALDRVMKGARESVGVVGEAGIGKSRLCYEFCERARARGIRVIVAQCVAHGKNVPLLPWMTSLRSYFGVGDRDPSEVARDKTTGRMVRLGASLDEDVPFMLDFLGVPDPLRPAARMDPEARRRKLLDLMNRLRSVREREEAAIFLWEDLHWIDAASESIRSQTEAGIRQTTLLLHTYRPEYGSSPGSVIEDHQIRLRPLEPGSTRELLADLLGRQLSHGTLIEAIQVRAAGNPFFVEEIVQSLVESQALRGTRGAYALAQPVDTIAIPDSVHAVLAARIDRLAEREKTVLHTASIIGKSFRLRLLAGLSGIPDRELETILHRLVEAEFVYEQAPYPDVEFSFKHPLTEEVAYSTQLGERRRALHGRLVKLLQAEHADRIDESAALLAYHLERAGRLGEAADQHERAAEWLRNRDISGSLRHWRRVIEIGEGLPETERDLERAGRAYAGALHASWVAALPEAEALELLEAGGRIADELGSPRLRARMLISYAVVCAVCANEQERILHSREALRLAQLEGDRELELSARAPLADALTGIGRTGEALAVIDEALAASSPRDHLGAMDWGFDLLAYFVGLRSVVLALRGDHEGARREDNRALELGRRAGEPFDWGVNMNVGWSACVRGDGEQALGHASEMLVLTERFASATATNNARVFLGWAHLLRGAPKDAVETLEQITAPSGSTDRHFPQRLVPLAEAHLALGHLDASRRWAEPMIALEREQGFLVDPARAHLVLARRLLHPKVRGKWADIEAHIERASELLHQAEASGLFPHVLEVRAEVARREREAPQAERLLREAHDLYTEMGATGHAERLARELPL